MTKIPLLLLFIYFFAQILLLLEWIWSWCGIGNFLLEDKSNFYKLNS
jgi:hypothetical protein